MNVISLRFYLPFAVSCLSLMIAQTVYAAEGIQQKAVGSSQAVHGGIGLLQMPTSRMRQEGDLSINYTDNEEYRFWSVSIQLFPWLESTVRYTDVRNQLYSDSPDFSGDQTLKDKGIDVKARLLQESRYLPEVSVGFRDFGGTGLFSSEFVALSKRVGDFDFHLGMGWGYLGTAGNTTNPFCEVKDSFCQRGGMSGRGGKIDYQNFFKGPASLFGGVEYQTPWQPLRLKLEYEGNDYSQDRAGQLEQDSKWNVGAVYRWGNFDFDLNYQRGNTLGFGVHYAMNLHSLKQLKIDDAPRPLMDITVPENLEKIDRNRLAADLYSKAGFVVKTTDLTPDEITLYGSQIAYRDKDESIERIGRILASELPESVKTYRIVMFSNNLPMVETVVDAEQFIAAARYESLRADVKSTYVRQDISQLAKERYTANTSGFGGGVEAFWIQTFGSPEEFYMYQAGLMLNGGYVFNENFALLGGVKATLLENFDKFNYKVDSQNTPLPRVRTYVREYVTRDKVTMDTLFAHWQDQIAPNVFGQLYGGYLETMFGGVGGELLYRPVDSNFAVGFDVNYVRQRSYENNFDFFDYKTFTGHVNVYWKPEFLPDTQLTFNIGQYLAKDRGVTVDFAKRFDSGIIVGAYAAITDVSSEEYGEGSFTKGFYLSIPFDVFSLKPSIGRGKLPWIPISRDGGQALNRPVMLYNITESRSPFYD